MTEHLGSLNTAVGAEVRRLRRAKNISQVELARRLGWRQSVISRREAGKLPWDVGVQLPCVAAALGTTASKVMLAAELAVEVARAPRLCVVAVAIRIMVAGILVHDQVKELVLSVAKPGRHHNIIYLASRLGCELEPVPSHEQGFLLSDGTFATRERALEVARAANQIIARCGGDEHALFSENLW